MMAAQATLLRTARLDELRREPRVETVTMFFRKTQGR
jgi:hypothetical protein